MEYNQKSHAVSLENKTSHAYTLEDRSTWDHWVLSYSDFAKCQDNHRSTSSYVYLLAIGSISWRNAKQTHVAFSSMAVEFIACYGHPIMGYDCGILSQGCVFWIILNDHLNYFVTINLQNYISRTKGAHLSQSI